MPIWCFPNILRLMQVHITKFGTNVSDKMLLSPAKCQGYSFSIELVSLAHFLHTFWRRIFPLLYSINWSNFIVWLPLLCEILGNMCIAIVSKPGCDAMNFEVKDFELKAFFLKSCYSRLRLWVGFFIYFKFTGVFFYLMFLIDV